MDLIFEFWVGPTSRSGMMTRWYVLDSGRYIPIECLGGGSMYSNVKESVMCSVPKDFYYTPRVLLNVQFSDRRLGKVIYSFYQSTGNQLLQIPPTDEVLKSPAEKGLVLAMKSSGEEEAIAEIENPKERGRLLPSSVIEAYEAFIQGGEKQIEYVEVPLSSSRKRLYSSSSSFILSSIESKREFKVFWEEVVGGLLIDSEAALSERMRKVLESLPRSEYSSRKE